MIETGLAGVTPTCELFDRLLSPANIDQARRRVVGNAGAPGSDGVTVAQLDADFARIWPSLEDALRLGTYRPAPLREVEIPKPDGGRRLLRIPTAIDRVVLQAIAQVLLPVWEPVLSRSSYAYRCGRGALEAVTAAREKVGHGLGWIAHLDIVKFFDRVDLRALSGRLRERIDDPLLLDLIERVLEQGSLPSGLDPDPERPVGLPQGSPLSPLLANIALDPLDRFLESRGAVFLRYADDAILLCHGETEARLHLDAIREFLGSELRLELHPEKTCVLPPHEAEFLGFSFPAGHDGSVRLSVSAKAKARFERELETSLHHWRKLPFEQVAHRTAERIEQWLGYYGSSGTLGERERCQAVARRLLRGWIWEHWGDNTKRRAELLRRGVLPRLVDRCLDEAKTAKAAFEHPALAQAFPNSYFSPYRLGQSRKKTLAPSPATATSAGGASSRNIPRSHSPANASIRTSAHPSSPSSPSSPPSPAAASTPGPVATENEMVVTGSVPHTPGKTSGLHCHFAFELGRLRLRFDLGAGWTPPHPPRPSHNELSRHA